MGNRKGGRTRYLTVLHVVAELSANVAGARLVGLELLADDGEVGLVSGQAEHDEVGVGAAQHVARVGVVVRLGALAPDVVHDLVLALAGHVGVRQDHRQVAPARIVAQTVVDVVVQAGRQPVHERRARRDAVTVEATGPKVLVTNTYSF